MVLDRCGTCLFILFIILNFFVVSFQWDFYDLVLNDVLNTKIFQLNNNNKKKTLYLIT